MDLASCLETRLSVEGTAFCEAGRPGSLLMFSLPWNGASGPHLATVDAAPLLVRCLGPGGHREPGCARRAGGSSQPGSGRQVGPGRTGTTWAWQGSSGVVTENQAAGDSWRAWKEEG